MGLEKSHTTWLKKIRFTRIDTVEFLFLLMMYSDDFSNRVTFRTERENHQVVNFIYTIVLFCLFFKFIVVNIAENPHFNTLIILIHVNKMAAVFLWRTTEGALSGDICYHINHTVHVDFINLLSRMNLNQIVTWVICILYRVHAPAVIVSYDMSILNIVICTYDRAFSFEKRKIKI